ncbi:MAG: hypothetical protein KGD66_10635, partial [Candidatus Lokiarchaeota archaeon]|nr:hypothetical protein [Candidatus Lokiarchaeota archaeon]
MLNQLEVDLITFISAYSSTLMNITFSIILLVFAILIYKRNSYKYGITLMISSIISLASNIIYFSIQYPFLGYRLFVELGLPVSEVTLILMIWSFVFVSLYTTSTIFLVVSIYMIYRT